MRLLSGALLTLVSAGILSAKLKPDILPQDDALRKALAFHASFDGGTDAPRASGDPKLYWAPSFKQRNEAKPGLPDSGEVALAKGEGKFGDALRFTAKKSPVVFFRGSGNVPFASSNWNGTVSFWLNVDPEGKLEPGFCDPIQITDSAWNDAAFFVEFEKRPESIPFRLGVYADFAVWNPGNRKFEEIPAGEKPLVTVDKPPFRAGRWTHVVFTFEHFNTGRPDGVARLYLDGQPQGELRSRQQTFTWDLEKAVVAMGLGYIGLFDELAIFNRLLSAQEIQSIHIMERGISSLIR